MNDGDGDGGGGQTYQTVKSLLPTEVFSSGSGCQSVRKSTAVFHHWTFLFARCTSVCRIGDRSVINTCIYYKPHKKMLHYGYRHLQLMPLDSVY